MASSQWRPPPSKSVDLDLTIVSAKHLKNVNWKNGNLTPYVVFWVDHDRRFATKSDESGSTSPVWNERFTLPLHHSHSHSSFLTLEIFHSKPSQTPKPLVATLRLPLSDPTLLHDPTRIQKFTLTRPSGRPQGKIALKLGLLCRTPNPNPNPNPNPSPPPFPFYKGYSSFGTYPDSYYHPGYYSGASPPPPPRPFLDRPLAFAGPSAPFDYSSYDSKPRVGRMGLGSGLAVGAIAGALGGLALEEGLKYDYSDKIAQRVESDIAARDDYSDYRDY